MEKLKNLFAEYGTVPAVIYFGIFFLVLGSFAAAIQMGMQELAGVELDATSAGGTLFAAWAATKVTQPLRIAATLVLTPLAAGVINRSRNKIEDLKVESAGEGPPRP